MTRFQNVSGVSTPLTSHFQVRNDRVRPVDVAAPVAGATMYACMRSSSRRSSCLFLRIKFEEKWCTRCVAVAVCSAIPVSSFVARCKAISSSFSQAAEIWSSKVYFSWQPRFHCIFTLTLGLPRCNLSQRSAGNALTTHPITAYSTRNL